MSAGEVADALGLDVEQVVEARGAASARRALSLDMPHDADEEEPVREVATEELGFAAAENAATLQRLAAGLSDRDREVLWLRVREDLTQSEISARVGCSQMHVSRIIRAAVVHMQQTAELTAACPAVGQRRHRADQPADRIRLRRVCAGPMRTWRLRGSSGASP